MDINLHPIVVHFPIALMISAMGFLCLSWLPRFEKCYQTSLHLLILAAVMAIPAVLTGWHEADELHLHHKVLDLHRMCAFVSLGGAWLGLFLIWILRHQPKFLKTSLFIILILTSGSVALTGFYGGKLVYEYGVGVKE